jgi:hypothetical protein
MRGLPIFGAEFVMDAGKLIGQSVLQAARAPARRPFTLDNCGET